MLLYIHVPFCRRKCRYCGFFSLPLAEDARRGEALTRAWLATLTAEIDCWKARLKRAGAPEPVESVFFGGGTPSLLGGDQIAHILTRLRRSFILAPDAEISLEANPESALADPARLRDYRAAGVTRLSLGVQSLDDAELALLGRAHSAREAAAALEAARAAGFSSVGLDLIWGLPGLTTPELPPQSQVRWLKTLREAVNLRPDHLSAYGLTLESGSPLAKAHARGLIQLPEEKAAASMYLAGADFLESAGYLQYEISNFARMGFACRHNLGYWEGASYLGFGPGATSTLETRFFTGDPRFRELTADGTQTVAALRWTNPTDLNVWQRQVNEDTPAARPELLDAAIRDREYLMLRLRTARGLDLKAWRARTGASFLKTHAQLTSALRQNGLASVRAGFFRLTRAGMLVSDTIIGHFFTRMEDVPPAGN